jgi:hypothetical protein
MRKPRGDIGSIPGDGQIVLRPGARQSPALALRFAMLPRTPWGLVTITLTMVLLAIGATASAQSCPTGFSVPAAPALPTGHAPPALPMSATPPSLPGSGLGNTSLASG